MSINKLIAFTILLMFFTSCARKVYFLEANKIEYLNAEESIDTDLEFASYFAGDAIDYIIFEMDLKNGGDDTLTVSYKNISLRIENMKTSEVINWEPLWKEDVIKSLDDIHSEERVNKRARDIGNAFDLGFNLLMIGTNGYRAVDAIFYSMDVASVMMEDARSHKLLTGSLEEQKAYVRDWVLGIDKLKPGEEGSWDILFPRQLIEGDAIFIFEHEGYKFTQEYRLFLEEERI